MSVGENTSRNGLEIIDFTALFSRVMQENPHMT